MPNIKDLPTDGWNHPAADGTHIESFWIDTTGGWDEVLIPDGVECKVALIQVHSGSDDFTQADNPDMFYYSSNADGSGWTWNVGAFTMSISKTTGGLGYVKAVSSGRKIAVQVLS